MGGRRRGEEIQGTPSAASRSRSGRGATRADAAPPCAQPGPTYHRSYDNCSKRVLRVVGMGLCGAFLVGVSGYVVVRDPTRSYVKPRGRTPSAPVVRKTARSYLRAPLRYDRAGPRDAEPPAPAHPDHALTHEEPQNIAADARHTSAWRASAAGPIAQDPTRASDVYPATRERRRGRRTSTCGAPGRRRLRRCGRTANRRLWIRR